MVCSERERQDAAGRPVCGAAPPASAHIPARDGLGVRSGGPRPICLPHRVESEGCAGRGPHDYRCPAAGWRCHPVPRWLPTSAGAAAHSREARTASADGGGIGTRTGRRKPPPRHPEKPPRHFPVLTGQLPYRGDNDVEVLPTRPVGTRPNPTGAHPPTAPQPSHNPHRRVRRHQRLVQRENTHARTRAEHHARRPHRRGLCRGQPGSVCRHGRRRPRRAPQRGSLPP